MDHSFFDPEIAADTKKLDQSPHSRPPFFFCHPGKFRPRSILSLSEEDMAVFVVILSPLKRISLTHKRTLEGGEGRGGPGNHKKLLLLQTLWGVVGLLGLSFPIADGRWWGGSFRSTGVSALSGLDGGGAEKTR